MFALIFFAYHNLLKYMSLSDYFIFRQFPSWKGHKENKILSNDLKLMLANNSDKLLLKADRIYMVYRLCRPNIKWTQTLLLNFNYSLVITCYVYFKVIAKIVFSKHITFTGCSNTFFIKSTYMCTNASSKYDSLLVSIYPHGKSKPKRNCCSFPTSY